MYSWDKFFKEKITKIFTEKETIIDIGGGLRISKKQGNRFQKDREWIVPLAENKDYKIMDPVSDYSPDIIGDIHDLPLEDDSIDAIICMAVLEHVENPFQAVREIRRVLKPDGYCFIYIPFLFYYHAEKGYYKDFWRFTKDGVEELCKDFSSVEVQNVRGAFGTWVKLSPLGRAKWVINLANFIDKLIKKQSSRQASGYNIFLVK